MLRFLNRFRIKPEADLEDQLYEARRGLIRETAAAEDHETSAKQHRIRAAACQARIDRINAAITHQPDAA